MEKRVKLELYSLFEGFLAILGGRLGEKARFFFYKKFLGKTGLRCEFGRNSVLWRPNGIFLGNNVSLGHGAVLHAMSETKGRIIIGSNVLISFGVVITCFSHDYASRNELMIKKPALLKDIRIGDNVWIGAKAIILGGSEIPDNSVIGAGAVVTKKLETPNSIYLGVPAKFVKKR